MPMTKNSLQKDQRKDWSGLAAMSRDPMVTWGLRSPGPPGLMHQGSAPPGAHIHGHPTPAATPPPHLLFNYQSGWTGSAQIQATVGSRWAGRPMRIQFDPAWGKF
ncbi:hypothetical protein XELAEV_18043649mg [Xenopus laevis]|uniref:Uncharacterized protein n=1 Tax=Xenopus laevis TaxID=8355 RepID=A0A974H315_XENLA|nr:hypothetical protein XELAEV_18043649mg [Xenopus laevis]